MDGTAPAESGKNEATAASAQTETTKDEPAAVQEGSRVSKEETVYVIGDASGKTSDIIVSEHLKNAAVGDQVEDVSELSGIENVKGEETFSKGAGNTLTWQTAGSDIYYRGKSEKDLPVSVDVSYKLDGKEISPEELAGKSGNVEIDVTIKTIRWLPTVSMLRLRRLRRFCWTVPDFPVLRRKMERSLTTGKILL